MDDTQKIAGNNGTVCGAGCRAHVSGPRSLSSLCAAGKALALFAMSMNADLWPLAAAPATPPESSQQGQRVRVPPPRTLC